jgi:DNA-binding response OmpR family regulator
MIKILVIDDDLELYELVSKYLKPEGFEVNTIDIGVKGVELALSGGWQMVILDVMLPDINGFEVLRRIRALSKIPVLMLTARGKDVDRIVGLEIGADDYLPKPFNPRELVARIHAILRRTSNITSSIAKHASLKLSIGNVEVDSGSRVVTVGGDKIKVTTVEFDLLRVLMESAGEIVSRAALIENVLGKQFSGYDRGIDMHISNLRRKLGKMVDGEDYIKTVRNNGYLFSLPR